MPLIVKMLLIVRIFRIRARYKDGKSVSPLSVPLSEHYFAEAG